MVKLSRFAIKCKICGVKLKDGRKWHCGHCTQLRRQIEEAHQLGDTCMTRDPEHESRIQRYAAIVEAGGVLFE